MVLYHSKVWSSEQLQAARVRNPAGIILWCPYGIIVYMVGRGRRQRRGRDSQELRWKYLAKGAKEKPPLSHDSEEQ